jgi:hypothetical protein
VKKIWIGLALLLIAVAIWGCAHKMAHAPTAVSAPAPDIPLPPPGCGASLTEQLAHVYHPDRLVVIERCKTVTGVIDMVRSEPDGDYHIRLRLDPGQGELTNARNELVQGGDLVVEPICEHEVRQADAISACQGFSGGVLRPKRGMHVRVTGPYVLDREANHGWTEIHPAVLIEEIE